MLSIIFGSVGLDYPNKISYVSDYFDAMFDATWFESPMAKRIIKEIDDSDYIDGDYIKSPVLGGISPRDLSSGCKALLILLNEPTTIVSGDRMGDNCYPLLLEMSKDVDLTITLCHYVELEDYEPLNIRNVITGDIITTSLDVMRSLID